MMMVCLAVGLCTLFFYSASFSFWATPRIILKWSAFLMGGGPDSVSPNHLSTALDEWSSEGNEINKSKTWQFEFKLFSVGALRENVLIAREQLQVRLQKEAGGWTKVGAKMKDWGVWCHNNWEGCIYPLDAKAVALRNITDWKTKTKKHRHKAEKLKQTTHPHPVALWPSNNYQPRLNT